MEKDLKMKGFKEVFESPDGGKTVYAREVGTNNKRLVFRDHTNDWNDYLRRVHWDRLASEHKAIEETLEKLKTLEKLCNK